MWLGGIKRKADASRQAAEYATRQVTGPILKKIKKGELKKQGCPHRKAAAGAR